MNKVAIYIRVSTHHQIDKDSLPLQRKDLKNYSKYVLDTNKYEIFEDAGFSAKNTDRPAFKKMMSKIKLGEFTHLLVWKIDRISRNLLDFCNLYEELKKHNVAFVSKNEQFDTSTAMGEAMLKLTMVFAELERNQTAERVTAVMLDRATSGKWNGAPIPLGYKWDKETKYPVVDEYEAEVVKFIYDKYLETNSTSKVLLALRAKGFKTKKGCLWNSSKVIADILRNPFYKGTYRYNYRKGGRQDKKDEKEWVLIDNNHEGIIDSNKWDEVQIVLDKNAEKNSAKFRRNKRTHVFSNLLTCDKCRDTMIAKTDAPRADGFRPSLYVCKGRNNGYGCDQKLVNEKYIGEFILSFINNILKINKRTKLEDYKSILLNGEAFKKVKSIHEDEIIKLSYKIGLKNIYSISNDKDDNDYSYDLQDLIKQKDKFIRAISRLDDLYLFDDVSISKKDYTLRKKELNNNILEIDKKIALLNEENKRTDSDFILSLKQLALKEILNTKKTIDYKFIITTIGDDVLKDFISTIIKRIYLRDRNVTKIIFKNGLEFNFEYDES